MTGAGLAKFIGKTITLTDSRTGQSYQATIIDAKDRYGKVRVQVVENGPWFELTAKELGN